MDILIKFIGSVILGFITYGILILGFKIIEKIEDLKYKE